MDRLTFYKEMYFKEHDLKHKLDDKVPVQIGILTLIVSISTYILKSDLSGTLLIIVKYNMFFAGAAIVAALFFLGKSYLNLGKTHPYREIASMNDFMKYDTQLRDAGKDKDYEEHLQKEFADCATHNRSINISRTEKLAACKVAVFIAFCITFINSLIYIICIL